MELLRRLVEGFIPDRRRTKGSIIGTHTVSTPSMIRFGQMTEDELFVTSEAAQSGVRVENKSHTDPLVILKHFGPGNPDAEPLRKRKP